MEKKLLHFALSVVFLLTMAGISYAEWENPDECTQTDNYTYDGTTEECTLGVKGESTCAYSCPHVPGTTYKYLDDGGGGGDECGGDGEDSPPDCGES